MMNILVPELSGLDRQLSILFKERFNRIQIIIIVLKCRNEKWESGEHKAGNLNSSEHSGGVIISYRPTRLLERQPLKSAKEVIPDST